MIVKGENSIEIMKELIEEYNDVMVAYNSVDSYYNNQKWNWYSDIKKQSQVMGKLLPFANLFSNLNVDIDSAITTLVSLFNYAKNKSRYYKLPDRFLTLRNQLSKNKTTQIVYIFAKAGLVDIKREGNDIWVKLNTKILCNDIYLRTKINKFKKTDMQKLKVCRREYETVFFYPYTKKTVYNLLKRDVLGITLAFNNLLNPYKPEILKRIENTYGKRQDIMYVEVPTKLISRILHIKETQLINYVSKLYKFTNYISKHDKVYIDSVNMEHFYNELYKFCDLADVKDIKLEDGHPEVTPNSAIIHISNFKNSKVGKYVLAHIEEYKTTIIRELNFIKLDSLISGTNFKIEDIIGTFEDETNKEDIIEEITNRDIKKSDIPVEYRDFVFGDSEKQQCTIINRTALNENKIIDKRTKWLKIEHPESLSFPKCCSFISTILEKLKDCANDEVGHYLKLFNKVKETFDEWVSKYKSMNNLDYVYEELDNYPDGILYSLV